MGLIVAWIALTGAKLYSIYARYSYICMRIGCHVQCVRYERMTFLMDHEYEVFDKNDMLLTLIPGSVMDDIKKQMDDKYMYISVPIIIFLK